MKANISANVHLNTNTTATPRLSLNTIRPNTIRSAPAGTGTVVYSESEWVEVKDSKMKSRFLYTNPVCVLITRNSVQSLVDSWNNDYNAMILSWLTPINNDADFIFSINKRRFSVQGLLVHRQFVLSIPVRGSESLLVEIGKCTGLKYQKFNKIEGLKQIDLVDVGYRGRDQGGKSVSNKGKCKANAGPSVNPFASLQQDDDDGDDDMNTNDVVQVQVNKKAKIFIDEAVSPISTPVSIGFDGACAHLICSVSEDTSDADKDHYLVRAKIDHAFVKKSHWNGKNFAPVTSESEPYMTFLGSQKFGYVNT